VGQEIARLTAKPRRILKPILPCSIPTFIVQQLVKLGRYEGCELMDIDPNFIEKIVKLLWEPMMILPPEGHQSLNFSRYKRLRLWQFRFHRREHRSNDSCFPDASVFDAPAAWISVLQWVSFSVPVNVRVEPQSFYAPGWLMSRSIFPAAVKYSGLSRSRLYEFHWTAVGIQLDFSGKHAPRITKRRELSSPPSCSQLGT
jgi:hypothetical protein